MKIQDMARYIVYNETKIGAGEDVAQEMVIRCNKGQRENRQKAVADVAVPRIKLHRGDEKSCKHGHVTRWKTGVIADAVKPVEHL